MESRFTAVQPHGLAPKSIEAETQSYTISVCVQVGTEKRKKNVNHPHLTAAVFNETGGHQRHESLFWSVRSE